MSTTYKLFAICIISIASINARNCPFGNQPMCGMDWVTYPNECALAAAYVELRYYGPCNKAVIDGELVSDCPQTYLPVCGRDAVTYMN